MIRRPPISTRMDTRVPYMTRFRSVPAGGAGADAVRDPSALAPPRPRRPRPAPALTPCPGGDPPRCQSVAARVAQRQCRFRDTARIPDTMQTLSPALARKIAATIAAEIGPRPPQVEAAVALLAEGATVPVRRNSPRLNSRN